MTESNANYQREQLDLDDELPSLNDNQWPTRRVATAEESAAEKAKAELDVLRDRMARLQADFENARWTLLAALYGSLYAALLLILSSIIFTRRDL